jgi:hypothetical protein
MFSLSKIVNSILNIDHTKHRGNVHPFQNGTGRQIFGSRFDVLGVSRPKGPWSSMCAIFNEESKCKLFWFAEKGGL